MTINSFTGLAIIITVSGIVSAECPNGWTVYENSCYHFGRYVLTFQEAEAYCAHYGAHLVHIETSAENMFLKSYLSDLKDARHWIGLKDDIIDGRWTWYATDTVATITSWYPGEPNGGRNENCVSVWASYNYNWVDASCLDKYQPLCKKRSQKPLCTGSVVG